MKKLTLMVLAVVLCFSAMVQAQEIPRDKRVEIEKMLRLTGMEKLINQMMTQMTAAMSAQMPEVPKEFWTKFQEKINVRELMDKIVPLYDKYYTLDDLKTVNAFYESPTGQKILSTLPQITQESMKIGQEWGMKIGQQAAAEAKAELDKKK